MFDVRLGMYQHYKGGLYKVIALGLLEETQEPVVVYESQQDSGDYKSGTVWVRPYAEFVKEIEVDGQRMSRFTLMQ